MNSQIKVKIIKKNNVSICKIPVVKEEIQNRQREKKMAAAVSEWVNDFRQRRRQETRQAINFYSSSFANRRQNPQSVEKQN